MADGLRREGEEMGRHEGSAFFVFVFLITKQVIWGLNLGNRFLIQNLYHNFNQTIFISALCKYSYFRDDYCTYLCNLTEIYKAC